MIQQQQQQWICNINPDREKCYKKLSRIMELEQQMKSAILNNTSRRKRHVSNDLNELRKEEKQQRKEEKPKL